MELPATLSLLNQDLYQLTQAQIVFRRFANVHTQYQFTCRNAEKIGFFDYVTRLDLEDLKDYLSEVKLQAGESDWLAGRGYFAEDYLDWLRLFRFEPNRFLKISDTNKGWMLRAEGSWLHDIFYEIFCLSFINQRYAENYCKQYRIDPLIEGRRLLNEKIATLSAYNGKEINGGLPVIEFGSRRRLSASWQEEVLDTLLDKEPESIVGTSNVYLARKKGIREIGTFAHLFVMAMQGIYPVQHSQKQAFRIWLQEYQGLWGTVLPDTFGDDKFFKDFTFDLAKGYDGVRHDSGEPAPFGEKVIQMYQGFKIDPRTKKLVFSDGLNIPKAIELNEQFKDRIQTSFGIGTDLTNDCGIPVPQNVMKITMSNGQDVCKLSNNLAKASCNNPLYLDYVKMAIQNY